MLHMKLRVSEALLKQILNCALRERVANTNKDRQEFIDEFQVNILKGVTNSQGGWKIKTSADCHEVQKVKFVDGKIAKKVIGR